MKNTKKPNSNGNAISSLQKKAAAEARSLDAARWSEERYDLAIVDTAIKGKTIMKSEAVSVGETSNYAYLALVHGTIEIRIPFAEHTNSFEHISDKTLKGATPNDIHNQSKMLKKLIGCKLEYIPIQRYTDDEGHPYVLASRKLALFRQLEMNWKGHSNLSVGDIVTCDILSVSYGKMLVYYCGVERIINRADVTLRYISDLREHYHTGDTIRLMVRDLVMDENGYNLPIFSGKHAEYEEMKARKHLVQPGRTYTAQIVQIRTRHKPADDNQSGFLYVLYLPSIKYPAISYGVSFIPQGKIYEDNREPFQRGQYCQLRVTGFTKNDIATGYMVDIHGHR